MGAIREELYLADKFSGTFKNFDAAANASIDTAKAFQDALNDFTSGFMDGLQQSLNASRDELADMVSETQKAADAQDRLANEATSTGRAVKDAESKQKDFTEEVGRSENAAKSLMGTVSKIAGAIGAVKLAKDFIETADEMSQITAKLNLINDGFQTTEELQQQIFESAQRTRSSYQDTAQLIARLGMNTGDTFKSNSEMVKFAENLNMSFKIAGASAQEQSSVILQLSQALAGGLLRGQEFNAVMSGAPNIIKNIADYMGVTVGEMRDLAAEGQITSDIIRNAMLGATDKINEQFGTLPKTFSGITTQFKNQIENSLGRAFDEWINRLNGEETEETLNKLADKLADFAVTGVNALMDIADAVTWVVDAIEAIAPVLITAGVAVTTYKLLHIDAATKAAEAWANVNSVIGGISIGAGILGGVAVGIQNGIDNTEAVKNAKDSDWYNNLEEWQKGGYQVAAYLNEQLPNSIMQAGADAVREKWAKRAEGLVSREPIQGNLTNRVSKDNWYNSYYGSRYTPNDELWNETMKKTRFNRASDWYNSYYGRDTGYHIPEESWKAVEDIKDNGVKIKGEVKLADEDLKMFRDIAEGRYMTNVNLETLAPNISVSVEGGASLSAEEIAAAVAQVIVEQRAERTAIAH